MKVVVVGGGVGGLTAATRLTALGHHVRLFEARPDVGGLASGFDAGGLPFDGGPYILLDRPGLEWAFEKIGIDSASLALQPVQQLYEVCSPGRRPVRIFLNLERTTSELERGWPGAGRNYERFVSEMEALRCRLAPLLVVSRPTILELARHGALGAVPFLLSSLAGTLKRSALPPEVIDSIAIWTHIAGQSLHEATSAMAFVPALIHKVGAFVPQGGMRRIPELLRARATQGGADIRCNMRVRRITVVNRRVTGVELDCERGEVVPCDAVISNYHGVGTYEELVEDAPAAVRQRLRALPLQSPGLCAYVGGRGRPSETYLRFMLDAHRKVTLAVSPAAVDATANQDGRFPLRLIAPMDHRVADRFDEDHQVDELEKILEQTWWREGLTSFDVVARRTPRQWGLEMNLYRDSMNPAMSRRLFLEGRMRHRSPWIRGLYLAGASTHPGQWVSFCAISGVLAADALHADAAGR